MHIKHAINGSLDHAHIQFIRLLNAFYFDNFDNQYFVSNYTYVKIIVIVQKEAG